MFFPSQGSGGVWLDFWFCNQTDITVKWQHISLFCNILCFKRSHCFASGLSSSHHGDMGCHACTLSVSNTLTHAHIPLSLCWGTIKTLSNAATYSSAHTLNCVNVWVHIIFQGCHSLRLFSPVFNYWTPWHCRPRMHDIPAPVCVSVCVFTPLFAFVNETSKIKIEDEVAWIIFLCCLFIGCLFCCECVCVCVHLYIRACTYMWVCVCIFVCLYKQLRLSTASQLKNWTAPPLARFETCLQQFWLQSPITPHHQLLWIWEEWTLLAFRHTHTRTHAHTLGSGAWVNCTGVRKIKTT